MCSINGYISFNETLSSEQKSELENVMKDIIIKAEDRGRDSFGYFELGKRSLIRSRYSTSPSLAMEEFDLSLSNHTRIFISNNRAEPTTEYVESKNEEDVHPFTDQGNRFFVVHNGTIANDKELEKQYDLKRKTKIDSAIIPELLRELWDDKTPETLCKILRKELIGSYALAIVDKHTPDTLWVATNYKPLYIKYDSNLDVLFFSSLETYFNNEDYNDIFGKQNIKVVNPYTLLKITKDSIEEYSLYNKDYEIKEKKKALIIASGGLDSTVCASWAKEEGYDITLLHFKYKCRAEEAENRAINEIRDFLDCELVEIPIDFFKDIIGGSRLTDTGSDLVKTNEGEASAELAWEWVPARNLIFFSIATGYAEAHDFDYIILGGNLEESGSYPDNELIFQKKFNDILPNAVNLQCKIEILTPVANLMKHEIVDLGLKIGSPLHLCWSCYENGTVHCGECGPCYMRNKGFKMNKIKDMIPYINKPSWGEDFKVISLKDGKWYAK